MSDLGILEAAVVAALTDVTSLRNVRGWCFTDRKALVASMGRDALPAAYVSVTGRGEDEISVSVFLGSRSQRNDNDARVGANDVAGVFELSSDASGALRGLVIEAAWQCVFVDERPVSCVDGLLIWEQRFEVRRMLSLVAPTFGGVVLAGTGSDVGVEVGVLERASSSFSFPGVDGLFEWSLGVRGREIVWRGRLHGADDAVLNGLEEAIEAEIRVGAAKLMVDGLGRSYKGCVAKRFERRGGRLRDAVSGDAFQEFVLTFVQLETV